MALTNAQRENKLKDEFRGVMSAGSSLNSSDLNLFNLSNDFRQRRTTNSSSEQDELVDIMEARRKLRKDDFEDDELVDGNKSRSQKGIAALIIILAFLTLAHIAAAFYLFFTPEKYEHPYECLTPNCKRMGKWLSEAMDKSVDPCDNFYLHTCGNWLKKHKTSKEKIKKIEKGNVYLDGIPFVYEGNELLGKFLQPKDTHPLNQILPFYHSCIFQRRRNMQGYQSFINFLAKLKLLHPLNNEDPRPSIARLTARIFKNTNKMLFIMLYATSGNYITLGISRPDKELMDTNPKVYADTMRKAFHLMKKQLLIEDDNEIETIIYLVMRFEAELTVRQDRGVWTQIFGFPDKMEEHIKRPKKFHSNYNARTASFRWDDFIDEVYVKDNPKSKPLLFFNYFNSLFTADDRFSVLLLEQFLTSTPYYTVFRYFQWTLIKLFAFDLTAELQTIMKQIFIWTGTPQAELCFRSVFINLNALAAERYIMDTKDSNVTDAKLKNLTTLITANILKLANDTLPPKITKNIRDTFETFTISETTTNKITHFLPIFYAGLNMSDYQYFDNVLQIMSMKAQNEIFKMLKVHPYVDWPSSAYSLSDVTLYYYQDEIQYNRFSQIPFGAVYEPFFGNDLPIMNFGGFGFWIVSFYMMLYTSNDLLSLVSQDRLLNDENYIKTRKLNDAEMYGRWRCIYNSLNSLEHSQLPGVKLNAYSSASKTNNLADVIGVDFITKITKSLKDDRSIFPEHQILPGFENYTPTQLLFQTIARHACRAGTKEQVKFLMANGPTPFELRINGAFRLTEVFAKTWKCSKKSYMNPSSKCEFFKKFNYFYIPYKEYIKEINNLTLLT